MTSTQTTNLHLVKPGYDEDIEVATINSNMDILDAAVSGKLDKEGGNVTGDLTFLYKTRRKVELRDSDDELLETYYLDVAEGDVYDPSWEETGSFTVSREIGIGSNTIELIVTVTGGSPSDLSVSGTDENSGFLGLEPGTYALEDTSTYNGFSNTVPSGSYVVVTAQDGAYQEKTKMNADGSGYFPKGLKTGDVDATGKKVKAYEVEATNTLKAPYAYVTNGLYYQGLPMVPVYYWGDDDPTAAEMADMPMCILITTSGHMFFNV